MVGKSEWTPALLCALGLCWKLLNGPLIGEVGGDLVGNCESDVLRPSYGGLVGGN